MCYQGQDSVPSEQFTYCCISEIPAIIQCFIWQLRPIWWHKTDHTV